MTSWNEIRRAATAFSKRWKNAFDEKSQAQSFLKEFFAVFGVDAVSARAARRARRQGVWPLLLVRLRPRRPPLQSLRRVCKIRSDLILHKMCRFRSDLILHTKEETI